MSVGTVHLDPIAFSTCVAGAVSVVKPAFEQNFGFYCTGTNRANFDMGVGGSPGGSSNEFSIEQDGVPANIPNNKFWNADSLGCSRTINLCIGVHSVSKSLIAFGHDGTTYFETRLNTGDSFNYFSLGSNSQGIFSNFGTAVRMINYNIGTNTLSAAGATVPITGLSYACMPESGAYSILAYISGGKFLRKTTGATFTTSTEFQLSALLGRTYFTPIALVHDSDYGVVATMEATTPFYPVIAYFNHNSMLPADVKYYKY